jgi:hypothetical protein
VKKLWSAIILIVALAFAPGCGTTAKAKARQDMENAKAAYEKCLQQHPDDPSPCEALKRAYEVDFEIFREAGKGRGPTFTGFIEVGPGGTGK